MNIKCPNTNTPQWREMVAELGTKEAYKAFLMDIPDLVTYKKISEIKLQGWQTIPFTGYEQFSDQYAAMSAKKKELESQGAQVKLHGDSISYRFPKKELYLQQSKLTRDGIKQEVARVIRSDDNIGKVYRIFAGTKGQGTDGILQKYREEWTNFQTGKRGTIEKVLEGLTPYEFQGKEHIVYIDGNRVLKVYKGEQNTEDYILGLLLHNYLFPNTAYKLLGFLEKEGNSLPVVEQHKVKDSEGFSLPAIGKYLSDRYQMDQLPDDAQVFLNRDIGIGVSDISPHNVFTVDDKLYFIDPIIEFSPSLNKELHGILDEKENGNKLSWNSAGKGREAEINNSQTTLNYSRREEGTDKENARIIKSRKDFQRGEEEGRLPNGLLIIKEPADVQLDNKIASFIGAIKGNISYVKDVAVDGRVIDANAVADVINRTIEVADGKAGIDTLPEEAAHIYVHWLPKNSTLLRDMMADIRKRPLYQQVMDEYSGNPQYQHPDGNVDKEKVAKEAIGKLIAGTIVGQYKDIKAKSLWQRLLAWIKSLFAGKDFNAYQVAASDILNADTGNLDISAAMEANRRGEYYFQLSDKDQEYIKAVTKEATEAQKAVINSVYLNPEVRVTLNEREHIYTDTAHNVYSSVTSLINGAFENDQDYILNREWGNDFDSILQGIAIGKKLSEISTNLLTPDMAADAYGVLKAVHKELTSDGSVVIPQVIVYDKEQKIAGSIDLLVVHPDGNVTVLDLKTYRDDRSLDTAHEPGEGSVLQGMGKLSKRMKHGIQVATYKKLLSLMGIPSAQIGIKYIGLQITGNKKDQQLHGFKEGDLTQLTDSSFTTYADKIVPTEWSGNDILADKGFREQEEPITDEQRAEDERERKSAENELHERVGEIFRTTEDWKKTLEDIKESMSSINENTLYGVDRLLATMEAAVVNKQDYGQAYRVALEAIKKQLTRFRNYLTETNAEGELANLRNSNGDISPEFLKVNQLAAKYLDNFQGLIHIEQFHGDVLKTPAQTQSLLKVQGLIEDVADAIGHIDDIVAKSLISDRTVNPLVKGAINDIIKKDRDITSGREWGASLGGNVLLDNVSKFMTEAREKERKLADEINEQVQEAANKLAAVAGDSKGNVDFSFMEVVKDGKRTGIAVNDWGTNYRDIWYTAEAPLLNDDGSTKQYIQILNKKDAKKEDLAFNIDLWEKKQVMKDFRAGEKIVYDDTGKATGTIDGDYHKYTDNFKATREGHMKLNEYGTWIPKKTDTEFLDWRNKYMSYHPYWGMVFKDGKPTGQVQWKEGDDAWFPKPENIVKREVAADGTKLVDDKYYTLMNPTNDKERAQSDFYKLYMKVMKEQIEKLPAYAMKMFERGFIPTLRGNFLELLGEKDVNLGALMVSQIKTTFSVKAHSSNNASEKGIPIMFMSQLQDPQKLARLEQQLTDLRKQKDSMKFADYEKRYNELKGYIRDESSKIKGEEINPDLATGLMAFVKMATHFHVMSSIEDQLLIAQKKLGEMTLVQEKSILGIKKSREVKGVDSRAYNKMKQWLDYNFYYDSSFTKDMAEMVIKRLQNVTSTLSIPFNITGMLNNALVASWNNRVDAVGHDLWDKGTLNKSIAEFHTEFIPGYLRTRAEFAARDKKSAKYSEKKNGSLYEYLVHHFNVVKHQNNEGTGKVGWLAKWGGYSGYEAGEYMVQSQTAMAILRSVKVKNSITGEECSLRDAYLFDPNTGEGKLREGFSLSHKELAAITHRIWKTNERIHGNYDAKEKIMLEKYWVGQLALQFHKWVFPNWQIRFQRNHFEEGLGEGMDIEGRYVTAGHFLSSVAKAGINMKKQMENWANLTQHQRNNLKKDIADMIYISTLIGVGMIVKALASGIPDDDPYLKKMANWLMYQSDRGVQEMSLFIPLWGEVEAYQLVKSPIAGVSSMRKFAMLLQQGVEFPFLSDEDRHYKSGAFKGQLKLRKVTYDIIPLLREMNQWTQLDQQRSFYIR